MVLYYLFESEDYEGGDIVGPLYKTKEEVLQALHNYMNQHRHNKGWQKISDEEYKAGCNRISISQINIHDNKCKCDDNKGCYLCI